MPAPNLIQIDGFVPDAQSLYDALATGVAWEEHIKARKTANFGQSYNYSGISYDDKPMHTLLIPIVNDIEAKLGFRPNNCLLNFYETGASTMGFHSDSTEELEAGTGVAIVSLGAERTLTFRSKQDREERCHFPLRNGALLYMPPEVQDDWMHAVLKQEDTGGRISLTFRRIRKSGM